MMAKLDFLARSILFGGLLATSLPSVAKSEILQSEIPFLVNNEQETSQCIRCIGPGFRDTGIQEVQPLAQMQEIFSARITGLAPFGGWTCRRMEFDSEANKCVSEPADVTDFCLQENPGSGSVALTIENEGTLGTNQPQNCTTDSANVAFLGNQRRFGKPDKDSFLFQANSGNRIIAILDSEPNRKNFGKSIILGLKQKNRTRGARFKKVVKGSLPLRIETAVPETGTYEIFVAQPNQRWRESFRGFYRLSTRGDTLAPRLSIDQDTIEAVSNGAPLSPLPSDAGCFRAATESALLNDDLEVRNRSGLSFQIKISQNGNFIADTNIDPHTVSFFRPPDEPVQVSLDRDLFTIELTARDKDAFAGSTRFLLGRIDNLLIDLLQTRACP